jgi:hypothetical protein
MIGLIETLRRREFVVKLHQQRKPTRVWGGGIQFFYYVTTSKSARGKHHRGQTQCHEAI